MNLANVNASSLTLKTVTLQQSSSNTLNIVSPNGLKVNGNTFGFPDYTSGVSKVANTNYVAQTNVFVKIVVSGQDTYIGNFVVDGETLSVWQINGASITTGGIFPVKAGSTYRYNYSAGTITIVEYPAK